MSEGIDVLMSVKGPKGHSLDHNLINYNQVYKTFSWDNVEQDLGLSPNGKLNIAFEAIDRHAHGQLKHKKALVFSNSKEETSLSYFQLYLLTNKFANVLHNLGLKSGERVVIFMPPLPEFYISFLGAIKIGAIVVPLSTSYMSDAVMEVLQDCAVAMLITTEPLLKRINYQRISSLRRIILVNEIMSPEIEDMNNETGEIFHYEQLMDQVSESFKVMEMNRDDPMLLLYTSGSTGKPKGVIHVHGGITHYYQTGKWVLDLHEEDIYWCTSDPSWVTGISYGIWAPLLLGVTNVIYNGEFKAEKWYEILAKYKVNVWYTTPTALRQLMNYGHYNPSQHYALGGLRHILSVGEPLNPMVIRWSNKALGQKVYDTWWMTETGGQLICNFRCLPIKQGSMGRPIPGIYAAIINEFGQELPPLEVGQLAIKAGWPAMMSGIWKDQAKFNEYFCIPPWYLTGDLAYRDNDGYFWFQGRVDDVIKKAGERIGPFEVENKLIEHQAVLEAGVIGKLDPLWGEVIKAFIVLRPGFQLSNELKIELQEFIKNRLGLHLVPSEIEACKALPRTRSGKILRRALKSMELGLPYKDISLTDDD